MSSKEHGHLLKILGIGFGLAISIGSAIGVGILRSPGLIAGHIGDAWLIMFAWVLGGVYCLLWANMLSELSTMMPRSGGGYIWAHHALGGYAGFVVGVCDWFQTTAAVGFLSVVFGEFASKLFAPDLPYARVGFSVGIIAILSALNWIGVRMGSGFQQAMSLLKALALVAFVVACFMFGGKPAGEASTVATTTGFAYIFSFILGLQFILGTYEGWQGPVYFAGENPDPSRTIPRSLYGGVLLIVVIYLMVNAALLHVLPMDKLAGSQFAGADAMSIIFGERSGQMLTVLALISFIGIMNAYLMANPRISLALARDRLLPESVTAINKGGTPYIALLILTVCSIVLTVVGTFELLLAMAQFFAVTIAIILGVTFFVLRRREPDTERPYRARFYPAAPLIVFLISIALFIGYTLSNPWPSLYAIIAIVLTYPVYLIIKRH